MYIGFAMRPFSMDISARPIFAIRPTKLDNPVRSTLVSTRRQLHRRLHLPAWQLHGPAMRLRICSMLRRVGGLRLIGLVRLGLVVHRLTSCRLIGVRVLGRI